MKKMTVVILTAALASAIMAGCSGGSENSSSNTSTGSANNSTVSSESKTDKEESKDNSKSESKNSETSQENSKESSKTESTASKSENSKEDKKSKATDAITYNNVEIKIDMEASPIIKKLGEPDHKETITSNDDNSEESYSYTYDNMTIYTHLKDNKQYVTDISIDGPGDAGTANGVKVGATKDSIAKIYGKVTDDKMASYEIGKNVMMFIFENDSVTNISLSKGLSDEELD